MFPDSHLEQDFEFLSWNSGSLRTLFLGEHGQVAGGLFFWWSPSFFTICSAACRRALLLSLCCTGSDYREHLRTSTNYHRNTPPSMSIVSHPSWELLRHEECRDPIATLALKLPRVLPRSRDDLTLIGLATAPHRLNVLSGCDRGVCVRMCVCERTR